MGVVILIEILLILLLFTFLHYHFRNTISTTRRNSKVPINWPILGTLPALLQNVRRIHDFATDILKESGGTLILKGPWLTKTDILATADPANIHYILSKNFTNYPKGRGFRKIFDILGDGIFNADYELWEIHRKTTMSLMNLAEFKHLLAEVVWRKVEEGLLPVLESVCKNKEVTDLQDIFQRFTFDSICALILDYDPQSLSVKLPKIECEKAFTDTEEALLYRNVLPEGVWKLKKWLQIGTEKTLSKSWTIFDEFIYPCIAKNQNDKKGFDSFNLSKSFTDAFKDESGSSGDNNKFLRDTFLSLMIAGRDTTSTALTWLFWLLSRNPIAEIKILEEIKSRLNQESDEKQSDFLKKEDLAQLVYLHGALCESLRLYPPVALEHKGPIEADTLPSGHWIDKNTKTILCFYSMGRMESIWGKDCLEFKPERWITEKGCTKHEPSYKFPAFNAGPRTCIGKEMAFTQMKIIAASVIYNYKIDVVKDHPTVPSDSIILSMKYGLKVRVTKRNL